MAQGPGAVALHSSLARRYDVETFGRTPADSADPMVGNVSAIPDSIARPSRWKSGMLVGAGVGAAFDLLLLWYAKDECDPGTCRDLVGPHLLVAPIVFALIGGLIGSGMHPRS